MKNNNPSSKIQPNFLAQIFSKSTLAKLAFLPFVLALFLAVSISGFAEEENLTPASPAIPVAPSFDQTQNTVSSEISSSSLSSSSLSSSSSSSSSTSVSSSLSSNSSSSSKSLDLVLLASTNQDNTVRTGGFSTLLIFMAIFMGIIGFQYRNFILKNRGLKTKEKRIR